MALIECPECKKQISDTAASCPQCGYSIAVKEQPAQPAPQVTYVKTDQPQWKPGIAALLSLLLPGAGQIYKGKLLTGLLWLIVVPAGYFLLILPGAILHVICIFTAYMGDPYQKQAPQ